MSPDKPSKGSLFASLRSLKPEEKAAPAPIAPAPAQASTSSLQPLLARLEKIESGLAEARQHDPGERIGALEQQLKATQEQAIKAMVTLREREQAQQQAQRDLEALMKGLSAQRRSEELDRQFREQSAAQQRRIEELEAKLLTQHPAAASAPAQEAVAQRLVDLEGGLSRLRGEAETLRQLIEKRTSELCEAARLGSRAGAEAAALVAGQEQRAVEARHDLEAELREGLQRQEAALRAYADEGLQTVWNEAALGRRELDKGLQERTQRLEAFLLAHAEESLKALKAEAAQGRQGLDARVEEVAQAQARQESLLQGEIRQRRQAEESLAAQCSAVLEAQRRAAAKTASGLAEQIAKLGRDDAQAQSRMGSESEALRGEFAQLREEVVAAEQRWAEQLAAGRQELAARFDAELSRLDSWLRTVREQAQSWDQTRALMAETASRVEQVGGFCDQGLRALDEKRMQFETEVRGLILARVLRLEERLGK